MTRSSTRPRTARPKRALDDGGRIVEEYAHRLSSNQQGPGHLFLRWLCNAMWDAAYCDQIPITPDPDSADECDFLELPKHPALAAFDRSDRKFVAVAAAHPERPPILEAADAKWFGWAPALREAGVTVTFLCEDDIRAQWEKKHAPAAAKGKRHGAAG